MIITYFRSSSFNAHDDCEQRYYLEYALGYKGPSNLKADRGSIVHKVMEVLAKLKKAQQDGVKTIEDDHTGKMIVSKFSDVEKLTERVFGHYTGLVPHHNWSEADLKICNKLVTDAITLSDGAWNPLNCNIVEPELHFDLSVPHDWAKYSYKMPDNTLLSGNLALKGTIDLITKLNDNTYEIVDYKTGRRLNWATGEEKTQEKLQHDFQLRLYHYAAQQVYPDIEQIMVTIYYIADGGPFTICFSKDDIPETEKMIRDKFELIRDCEIPKLTKSWKCQRLCPFSKVFPNVKQIQEFRTGQVTPYGENMSLCELVKFEIQRKGMARVNKEYTSPNHNVGFYQAPGSIGV